MSLVLLSKGYEHESGTAQQRVRAWVWYCSAKGTSMSLVLLSKGYEHESGTAQQMVRAWVWYCSAKGTIMSLVLLSKGYEHESGTAQQRVRAWVWYCSAKADNIGIWYFSDQHRTWRSKSKDWFDSESGSRARVHRHIYTRTVVSMRWHNKNQNMCVGLVQSGHHHHLIDM